MSKEDAAIIEIAKNYRNDGATSLVLSSGVRARIMPVAAGLIEEAQASVKEPPVPKWMNEDKGKLEDNPNDPEYLAALDAVARKRVQAAMDTIIMFGVVLLDENDEAISGAPDDIEWVNKVKWMGKRGLIDIEGLDFEDPMDREFAYKKYFAVLAQDLQAVLKKSGFGEEDVRAALDSFPDNPKRRTDTASRTKRGR